MGSLPSTTVNGIVNQSQVNLVKWSMPIRARDRHGSQRQPACLCHHDGEAEAGQPSASSCILPEGSFRSQRNLTGGQPASTRSTSAAPRKKLTLRVQPMRSARLHAGGLRARFGGVTCNGSLTDHIVRVSLDADVL